MRWSSAPCPSGWRTAQRAGLGSRLIGARFGAEEFGKKQFHRSRGTGIGPGVVSNARDLVGGRVLVRKTVHCIAIYDQLKVDRGTVHFLDERGDSPPLGHVDPRLRGR